jgi:hypothetical protein
VDRRWKEDEDDKCPSATATHHNSTPNHCHEPLLVGGKGVLCEKYGGLRGREDGGWRDEHRRQDGDDARDGDEQMARHALHAYEHLLIGWVVGVYGRWGQNHGDNAQQGDDDGRCFDNKGEEMKGRGGWAPMT